MISSYYNEQHTQLPQSKGQFFPARRYSSVRPFKSDLREGYEGDDEVSRPKPVLSCFATLSISLPIETDPSPFAPLRASALAEFTLSEAKGSE